MAGSAPSNLKRPIMKSPRIFYEAEEAVTATPTPWLFVEAESWDESSPSTTVNRSSSWPGESTEELRLALTVGALLEGGGKPGGWPRPPCCAFCHLSKFISTVVEPVDVVITFERGSFLPPPPGVGAVVLTEGLLEDPLQEVEGTPDPEDPRSFMSMVEL